MQEIDKSAIRIRPYVEADNDQVVQILLQGFDVVTAPVFRKQATHPKTILSILTKSVIYASLIELALFAYANSKSSVSSPSMAGLSAEDLRSFWESLTKPESAQSLILHFVKPSLLIVWVMVSVVVAVTTFVGIYRMCLAGTAEYIEGCFKDDLSDIQGYYQSQKSTGGKKNRSAFWVACLDSHPQLVLGCIALDDNFAHQGHLKRKHLAMGGSEETFKAADKGDAELRRLSVDINYRRLGISRMLMEHLVKYAKAEGFRRVWFSTTFFQKAALHGYIRFGFAKEKAGMYGDFIKLWFGTLNLYATEEQKEEQRRNQEEMLKEINSW
ncbi:hypothetical protein BC939DRAFT_462149 [Gamsiella multidivaricata]|uniref:uncharacterized protein n=1 Tax=Gamsiella multidivaricata TaxID=101098 RepID=UPI0022201056|nr:uncharacterized protein BC939DRAFT_462149 [Gamsiella multidivaricata]KAG0366802.1 N-acetyltransferase 8 [Gamsiella multidivaricata]KAI7818697.1 hypothetical protein BC939DRAFT_462149 [Gamsiella multidivaricata]